MNEKESIQSYTGILFIHKKNKILSLVTWMDFKGTVLSKTSQAEKDKPPDFTCLWNLEKNETKLIDTENRLVTARGQGRGEMDKGNQKV